VLRERVHPEMILEDRVCGDVSMRTHVCL
jgi:hypothetical protein